MIGEFANTIRPKGFLTVTYEKAEPVRSQVRSAPSSRPPDDRISQLRQLAELRDSGVLTDEEFHSEKARILGG
jgi:hypothetical protein